jgi:hypothetical protein
LRRRDARHEAIWIPVGGHGPDADFTSAAIITAWTSLVRTNVIFDTHEQKLLKPGM